MTSQLAFERVQLEDGIIHSLHRLRRVQRRKYQADTGKQRGNELTAFIMFEEKPQAFVFEALDHEGICKT
jgi:hypothetical protein